jgi:hypothetical protein
VLDPRAIAALGIGYGAALVARIGLWQDDTYSVGGAPDRKKKRRAGLVYNPMPVIDPAIRPVEEAEALLLIGAL